MKAYVDGSYNIVSKRFGYGVVLLKDDNIIAKLSKGFSNPELAQMRNVAGEIMGAGEAMKRAKEMGEAELTIYHDYEGISKWCTGEWKTKKTWTKKYKAFFDEISKEVKINFIKVDAHSGDTYNDMADELAKEAVGN